MKVLKITLAVWSQDFLKPEPRTPQAGPQSALFPSCSSGSNANHILALGCLANRLEGSVYTPVFITWEAVFVARCPVLGLVPENYWWTEESPATAMIRTEEHGTQALWAGFTQSSGQKAQVGSDHWFQLHNTRLQKRQMQALLRAAQWQGEGSGQKLQHGKSHLGCKKLFHSNTRAAA